VTSTSEAPAAGRLAAFGNPGFLAYWVALMLTGFAIQIQTVSVGWFVYDLTRNPLDLGLVGLSQFLPALLLVLVTGHVADHFPRRAIIAACLCAMALAAVALLYATSLGADWVWLVFVTLALFGLARAFYNPARQAIVPNLVPAAHLANAIAATTTINQFSMIGGPMVGGLLYAVAPGLAYGAVIVMMLVSALLIVIAVPRQESGGGRGPAGWQTVSAGFRFIWEHKPVLGAISLDLFAVLFGGAMALLPIYARDILAVGPEGLGLLRAAPAIGAIMVGILFMVRPLDNHAGIIMFASVAGFGLATLVFAVSGTLWLSMVALVFIGGFDMVSVNIRSILVQLWTPDEVRGRVNSVNSVFIGASNELGAFRAGVMAAWIGPVAAVALGGVAILAVAGTWARLFPQLRMVRHLR